MGWAIRRYPDPILCTSTSKTPGFDTQVADTYATNAIFRVQSAMSSVVVDIETRSPARRGAACSATTSYAQLTAWTWLNRRLASDMTLAQATPPRALFTWPASSPTDARRHHRSTWGIQRRVVFTARRSYASAVLAVVILSVRPSVCLSVCLSHACFVTNPKNLPAIFLYHMKGQSF